jgi:hypothetical protein
MSKDTEELLDLLWHSLETDNIDKTRKALVELAKIRYSGNYAAALAPYKIPLIKYLIRCLKSENFILTKTLSWQLRDLGATWRELDLIDDGVISARGY